MRYGRAITGGALAGAAGLGTGAGKAAASRHVRQHQQWATSILAEDERLLRSGQALPPIPEPREPAPRKEKGIVRCYLTGILIGGVGAWLVAFLAGIGLIQAGGQDAPLAEKLMSAQLIAFLVGLGGFVGPGVLIGAGLWLAEVRGRLRQDTALFRRYVWEQREVMRQGLATGRLTTGEAISQLSADG